MKIKSIPVICMLLTLGGTTTSAQEKEIYIPNELRNIDFACDTSRYCYAHSVKTPNVAVFWEKGFGDNVATAANLEGQNMKVNLNNLTERLEDFYHFFKDTLQFIKPGSKAEKYRMMVMLNYSLEGTAYGGDYDNTIGALWITPQRVQDNKLNCIAHELGHSFQSQISCDGQGECWGGGGIFEMASQWMLWQVNPEWVFDENYHFKAWTELTHKHFLSMENIYHSPYVLEYWGTKHGKPFIAELFRNGKRGEDPVTTYQRITNITQEQWNDEVFDCYRKLMAFDDPRIHQVCKPLIGSYNTPLQTVNNEQRPVSAPEEYGFNAIKLKVPEPGKNITVRFRGEESEDAGWHYGFVGITPEGDPIYGEASSKIKGKITFKAPADRELKFLYLVVTATPSKHTSVAEENPYEPSNREMTRYPYSFTVK